MTDSKRTPESRFWAKVNKTDGCWLWTGSVVKDGYAQFMASGRRALVHRWAWEFTHGAIQTGLLVCHRCDTPLCVNPDHLFLGTHKDNSDDCAAKGRLRSQKVTRCPQGHEYSPQNTAYGRMVNGKHQRRCIECMRQYDAKRNSTAGANSDGLTPRRED